MKTTIQEQDGNMIAYLEGSLDTSTAPETEKAMRPLYECEGKDIIFGFRPEAISLKESQDAYRIDCNVELTENDGEDPCLILRPKRPFLTYCDSLATGRNHTEFAAFFSGVTNCLHGRSNVFWISPSIVY